jgi:hypothetical protein
MSTTDILPQSSGPPRVATDDVRLWWAETEVRWHWSMLPEPRPAESLEDLADVEAAQRALAEPGESVPYEVVRRELGLV